MIRGDADSDLTKDIGFEIRDISKGLHFLLFCTEPLCVCSVLIILKNKTHEILLTHKL